MPKKLTLIIGVALSIVSVFLVKFYLDQQRLTTYKQAQMFLAKERQNQTAVLVAKRDIRKGTLIEGSMLDSAIVPNEYVQPQAVTSLDKISGMAAAVDIASGEQISRNKLSASKEEPAYEGPSTTLAMTTPIGRRAMTVPVDTLSSVGGMVRPGDYVDVMVTLQLPVKTAEGKEAVQVISVPILQNTQVLAVGQDISSREERPQEKARRRSEKEETKKEMPSIITLAALPQEANIITFLLEQGVKLHIALRSPSDSQVQMVQPINWEALFQRVLPSSYTAKEKPREESPKRKIEVYRGFQKEDIYLPAK